MSVFKIDHKKGFTVMSNSHLRDKRLSLKAKGLLSQMLSLPSDWDYSLSGLSYINRESTDAIRSALNELEKAGYLKREQGRDPKGKLTATQFTIYEQPPAPLSETEEPITENPHTEDPITDNPHTEKPSTENPHTENPHTGNPSTENPTQQNKDIQSKDKINTDPQNTDSFPFNPQQQQKTNTQKEPKGKEPPPPQKPPYYPPKKAAAPHYPQPQPPIKHDPTLYREIIKKNIDYEILISNNPTDKERIDEITDLMTETICTTRQTLRIAGDDYPSELVRSKYLKLTCDHLQFVLDCMKQNTTQIRSIKQYLKAVLFNAPSTMDNYYTSLVAHDMSSK